MFNVLLKILDDGRLTDGQGHVVDFKHCVIIMTSNVGSQWILEYDESNWTEAEGRVMEALRETFRPEFLNRVDDIVVFKPLTREDLGQIMDLQLKRVDALLADRRIRVEVTPEAKGILIAEGYDPVYGARPLKRVIQRRIQNPLALELLEGHYGEGDLVRVVPSSDGKGLEFVRVPGSEAAAEPVPVGA